jgi:hypothetical protein
MKKVIEHIQDQDFDSLICMNTQQAAIDVIRNVQHFFKHLLNEERVGKQDIEYIGIQIKLMKEIVISFVKNDCMHKTLSLSSQNIAKELIVQTLQDFDHISSGSLKHDIVYLQQSLREIISGDGSNINQKVMMRLLSIIQELVFKYDQMFITIQDVFILTNGALHLFVISSMK